MKNIIFCALLLLCCVSYPAFSQFESETTPVSEGIDSVKKINLLIYPGFGLGLFRNELAPQFFINIGINHKERYEVNLNTNSIFFFERGDDKNYHIYRNTFLNGEFLLNFSPFNRTVKNWNGIGIGYLIESKGQYFRETTMMVYYKRRLRYFALMPGVIIADDFKEVFPVISIKL
jgi:hypothetical protein